MATTDLKVNELKDFIKIKVRFSEVDSIRVVWHGSYVAYLEDGREAFGRRYGLGYNDMFKAGLTAPIVDVSIQYKSPATVDDILVLETRYVPSRGAKLVFDYLLYKLENKDLSDEEAFSPKEERWESAKQNRTFPKILFKIKTEYTAECNLQRCGVYHIFRQV